MGVIYQHKKRLPLVNNLHPSRNAGQRCKSVPNRLQQQSLNKSSRNGCQRIIHIEGAYHPDLNFNSPLKGYGPE
ncbi:hypothetical protein D3C75_640810 [compost metagenome]